MKGAGVLLLFAVAAAALGGGQSNAPSPTTDPRQPAGRRVRRPLRGMLRDGIGASRDHGTHQGFDIVPTEGDRTVYAYGDGTVDSIIDGRTSALQARRRAGLYIDVTGDDGNLHRYLHLFSVAVKAGQRVRRDQPIATIDGTHLHFEIRQGNRRTGKPLVPDFG